MKTIQLLTIMLPLIVAMGAILARAENLSQAAGSQILSIAHLLTQGQDDQKVTLQGFIIRKIGHEKYIFSDGTGEIRIEIDDDDFPSEPIDATTQVEIVGEFDKDFVESPEIDVDFIKVLGS